MLQHFNQQIATLKDYGSTVAMGLRYVIMKKVLNKHIIGDSTMVSKELNNLGDEDLLYIEQLLAKELAKEMEQDKHWQSKNGYHRPHQKSRRILSCMNAIKSQRHISKVRATKW
jgi:hypothetical protein